MTGTIASGRIPVTTATAAGVGLGLVLALAIELFLRPIRRRWLVGNHRRVDDQQAFAHLLLVGARAGAGGQQAIRHLLKLVVESLQPLLLLGGFLLDERHL